VLKCPPLGAVVVVGWVVVGAVVVACVVVVARVVVVVGRPWPGLAIVDDPPLIDRRATPNTASATREANRFMRTHFQGQ